MKSLKETVVGKTISDITMSEKGYFEFRSPDDEVLFIVDNMRVLDADGEMFGATDVKVRKQE